MVDQRCRMLLATMWLWITRVGERCRTRCWQPWRGSCVVIGKSYDRGVRRFCRALRRTAHAVCRGRLPTIHFCRPLRKSRASSHCSPTACCPWSKMCRRNSRHQLGPMPHLQTPLTDGPQAPYCLTVVAPATPAAFVRALCRQTLEDAAALLRSSDRRLPSLDGWRACERDDRHPLAIVRRQTSGDAGCRKRQLECSPDV